MFPAFGVIELGQLLFDIDPLSFKKRYTCN